MRNGILLLAILFSIYASAALTPAEKSTLRFHLENLRNEVELLVRNQRSDKLDLQRQEREFTLFEVFDRIPMEPRVRELEQELRDSATRYGLKVSRVRIQRGPPARTQAPPEVFTDTKRFRFSEDQLVEKLPIEIQGKGPLATLYQWTQSWPESLVRWVELRKIYSTHPKKPGNWEVHAQALRFRKLKYPKLKPRNPLSLLPSWARQDPQSFAANEPFLWKLVTETQKWTKKSEVPYENRRAFFLNDERMTYFLKKTEWHAQDQSRASTPSEMERVTPKTPRRTARFKNG